MSNDKPKKKRASLVPAVSPDVFEPIWNIAHASAKSRNVVPITVARAKRERGGTGPMENTPLHRVLAEVKARVPEGLFMPVSRRIIALLTTPEERLPQGFTKKIVMAAATARLGAEGFDARDLLGEDA